MANVKRGWPKVSTTKFSDKMVQKKPMLLAGFTISFDVFMAITESFERNSSKLINENSEFFCLNSLHQAIQPIWICWIGY